MQKLRFDNAFLRELPADPAQHVAVRQVAEAYSRVEPTPVAAPKLIAWSAEMAAELGLAENDLTRPEFARVFAGNALMPGMEPWAAN